MKRLPLFHSIALGLCFACAASAADVKADLQANYTAVVKAFQKKDLAGMSKFLAPNYFAISEKGKKVSREEVVKGYEQQIQMLSNATWDRKVAKATAQGKDTFATVQSTFKGEVKSPDGKNHKFELNSTVEDKWNKGPKGWILLQTKILKRDVKVDGKPMSGA